jgi:pentatricopeptide repeat protein
MIPMRKQCLLLLWLILDGGNCLLPVSSSRRIHSSTPHQEWLQRSTIPCMSSHSVDEGLSHRKLKEIEQNIVRLGRSGRTDDALALYYEIGKPTIRLLNGAIDVCSRARATRLDSAFEILEDGVRTKNLQPNVFTFGALMSACSRARDANKALELLRSMQVSWCYLIYCFHCKLKAKIFSKLSFLWPFRKTMV